jgi:hypothetical protein
MRGFEVSGKMSVLLFSELINFTNKNNSRKVQNYYLSHEKYFERSKIWGKVLRDILEYE